MNPDVYCDNANF